MSKPTPKQSQQSDCYDYPQYWDIAFRSESKMEADFFEDAFRKYCRHTVNRVLEPGCGGGRLVMEMAGRGYDVSAFDLNEQCVQYVKKRLNRRALAGNVFVADMTNYVAKPKMDAAFCTFNTFRHLTSEKAAKAHLESIAASLRKGGIYILGFHLLPPDADEECVERWNAKHGATKVSTTLRVLDFNRRTRLERIRFSLRVRSGKRDIKIASEYQYRIYMAKQFQSLLKSVPSLELCDVYDFWYDIDDPLTLDDELGDAVFVLRKV